MLARKPRRKTSAAFKKSKAKAIKNLASFKNDDGTQKENSIEKKIRLILDSLGLFYIQEKKFTWQGKNRYFDFYVTNGVSGFCCEIMGTYWHSQKYLEGTQKYATLTKIQKKNLRNDKFKREMLQDLGIPLLCLWEDEIKRSIDETSKKIIKYVQLYLNPDQQSDIDN